MISVIVLAAGTSSRMGKKNKLLLPWKSQTVIESVIDELLAANLGEIIVVLGHEKSALQKRLNNRKVKLVDNPNYSQGMGTSLVVGIQAAHPQSKGFMICLGDLPLIQTSDYQHIARHFKDKLNSNPKSMLIPTFEGKWGHPKVFSSIYRERLLQQSGDQGAKNILRNSAAHIHELPFPHDCILQDIDTFDAYQKAKGESS